MRARGALNGSHGYLPALAATIAVGWPGAGEKAGPLPACRRAACWRCRFPSAPSTMRSVLSAARHAFPVAHPQRCCAVSAAARRLEATQRAAHGPAVQPGDAVVGLLAACARAEHHVAQLGGDAARVIELAIDARHDLHAAGAQIALPADRPGTRPADRPAARPPSPPARRRPRSPCRRPARDIAASDGRRRRAASRGPCDHSLTGSRSHSTHMRQVSIRSSMRSTSGRWPLKCCPQLARLAFRVPAFLVAVGMEHGDQVVEFAAAQRIMHEMGARAGPQHHVGPPQIVRHLVALEHGAIGDVAGDARRAVADDLLARSATTCRRSRSARGPRTRSPPCSIDGDASPSSSKSSTRWLFSSVDQVAALAGFEEDAVDVGAMGDRVRLAEARRACRRRAACG